MHDFFVNVEKNVPQSGQPLDAVLMQGIVNETKLTNVEKMLSISHFDYIPNCVLVQR